MAAAVAHELVQKSLVGEALERGPVAVFVADDEQRYIAVNAHACELLGYTREELLALRVTDVAANDGAGADYAAMIRDGGHAGLAVLCRKDGGELPVHFIAGKSSVGGIEVWVGVCWPVAG